MADDNKKQPEESFKDKTMRSIDNDTFDEKEIETARKDSESKPEVPRSSDQTQGLHDPSDNFDTETTDQREVNMTEENPDKPEKNSPISKWSSVGSRATRTRKPLVEPEFFEETEQLDPKTKKIVTRKKEDHLVRKIVLIVIATLVVLGAVLGFSLYNYVQAGLNPLDPDDSQLVQVEIPSGSSTRDIGDILEKDKVIRSGMVFNYYTRFNNITDFQSGYYQMSPDMTLDEISSLLQQGGTAEPVALSDAKITIPEGYDIPQIADSIAELTEGRISAEDFIAVMNDEAFFQRMLAQFPTLLTSASEAEGVRYRLEGYLFPATYNYYADETTAEGLAEQMITAMNDTLSPYYETIQNQGYTVQQVLTLASLVEREGVKQEDRRNIAQVFINRIGIDMPLQSDISILYALGEHKEVVTIEDTQVDSPYNLYLNTGYGPGPFDNPGVESIDAVLNPTPNNYYYFVADISTGEVYFAETFEQHQEYVDQYVNN